MASLAGASLASGGAVVRGAPGPAESRRREAAARSDAAFGPAPAAWQHCGVSWHLPDVQPRRCAVHDLASAAAKTHRRGRAAPPPCPLPIPTWRRARIHRFPARCD